ncbi:MAG: GNAT family N-acetyltransferase [bacterium]|nr:GNAT family N-acetyltransferase [bacterium]
MTITSRFYSNEDDYRRIRELLMECYRLNGNQHSWAVDRLDWWRYTIQSGDEISGNHTWHDQVRLWETAEGKLVGVAHPEDGLRPGLNWGDIHLEIHPEFRELEEVMFAWAESNHQAGRPADLARWPLYTYTYEGDGLRERLLTQRGYAKREQDGYKRCCRLSGDSKAPDLPAGFSIRTVKRGDDAELVKWSEVNGSAFGNPDNSPERCRLWFRTPTRHIDLVVVAPTGSFAAYCLIWLDEHNLIGMFEPVGTHREFRRRGLARAMLLEGLTRLRALGYRCAYIGAGMDPAANGLYESVGFTEAVASYEWLKQF